MREHLVSDVPLGVWAQRRPGFLHHPALRRRDGAAASEDFFGFVCGAQFRREPLFPRDCARSTAPITTSSISTRTWNWNRAIEDFAYYSDEPGADAGALPVWFLSRMSRQHVTVAFPARAPTSCSAGISTYLADRLARSLRLVPESAARRMLRAAATVLAGFRR